MSWLVDNLRRQDTVDVAGPVGQALRQLQEMACSPLDRLKTIRVCAKTFEKVRQDLRVTRASSSSALSVDVDVNRGTGAV